MQGDNRGPTHDHWDVLATVGESLLRFHVVAVAGEERGRLRAKAGNERELVISKLTKFVALVMCLGLVLAGVASAGAPFPTEVTIKEQGGDFHGKVKSPDGGQQCIEDRKVTVLKKKDGPDKTINSDTSDTAGNWDTGNTHVGPGKYYAKAKHVLLKTDEVLCETGKSETVTVN